MIVGGNVACCTVGTRHFKTFDEVCYVLFSQLPKNSHPVRTYLLEPYKSNTKNRSQHLKTKGI